MEHSFQAAADEGCSVGEEFSCLLWKLKIHSLIIVFTRFYLSSPEPAEFSLYTDTLLI